MVRRNFVEAPPSPPSARRPFAGWLVPLARAPAPRSLSGVPSAAPSACLRSAVPVPPLSPLLARPAFVPSLPTDLSRGREGTRDADDAKNGDEAKGGGERREREPGTEHRSGGSAGDQPASERAATPEAGTGGA